MLDHLQMGTFYFRKREYEYFLRQNEYLFGTDLRSFWDWYFRGVAEPCAFCDRELIECDCEHFEDGKPAPVKNPGWWKQVTSGKHHDPRINIDDWAQALLGSSAALRERPAARA